MLTAIYVRVSTESQATEGTSLDTQQETCLKKAREMNINEQDIAIYREEGVTGEDLDRPELDRLRTDIRNNKINTLIITHPDRLSRDLYVKVSVCRELENREVNLIFHDVEYKNTPEGQLFFNLMSSIAQYELSQIRSRTVGGRKKAVRDHGKIMPMRVAPYGYDMINQQLVINESEAEYVKLIYQWYVYEFKTLKEIGEQLYLLGAMPKRAESRNWSASSIGRILSNEAFIGKYYYNKRATKKVKREEGGKSNKTASGKTKKTYTIRDKGDWILVNIPPIIDLGLFEIAQQQKKKNLTRKGRNVKQFYLLKGMMKCAHCGRKWESTTYSSKTKKGTTTYQIYRCANKYPRKYGEGIERCNIPTVRTDVLDEFVWNMIVQAIKNPENLKNNLNEDKSTEDLDKVLMTYKKQRLEKEKEKEKIKHMYRKGIISEEELDNDMNEVMKDISKFDFEIEKIEDKVSIIQRQSMSEDLMLEYARQYKDLLENDMLHDEKKREILDRMIDEIIISYNEENKQFNVSFYGYLNGFYNDTENNLVLELTPQEI
ncbi:hypothetical protein PMSM_16870 [Paenibacillus macquariensis subsp. macquariensis]|nr:hypothetical protein PMSM_16870 [Paenibacillus macquariensis subsp. macquariensis]